MVDFQFLVPLLPLPCRFHVVQPPSQIGYGLFLFLSGITPGPKLCSQNGGASGAAFLLFFKDCQLVAQRFDN
jgi:hypothetical protein